MALDLQKTIKDLAILAIGVLVVDVIFEAAGLALASLNSAVANLSSYVNVATLASVITTLVPIAKASLSSNERCLYHRSDRSAARAFWCRLNIADRLITYAIRAMGVRPLYFAQPLPIIFTLGEKCG